MTQIEQQAEAYAQEYNHLTGEGHKLMVAAFIAGSKATERLPEINEAGIAAVKISETVEPKLTAQEQAFFIAGFQECIKWLSSKYESPSPSLLQQENERFRALLDRVVACMALERVERFDILEQIKEALNQKP